jgi:hypothetical protein
MAYDYAFVFSDSDIHLQHVATKINSLFKSLQSVFGCVPSAASVGD